MKILIVDTETTGLEANDQACELAATLYQVRGNSGAIASASTLLAFEGQNPAKTINRIDEIGRAHV